MKKPDYEVLIERRGPKPDGRAARLDEASRNLETLEALARAQAEARANAEDAEPATKPLPRAPSPSAPVPGTKAS